MWEHLLKLDKSNVQCKWCHNTYKILDHYTHIEIMIIIKEHLYYEKYNEENRLKWENDHFMAIFRQNEVIYCKI